MRRVRTGIEGLDPLIEGGIPEGSSVLVSGGAGTGKTIFATQFIYNGAKDYGEPGIYVSTETNLKNIVWNMQNFNWDIRKLQEKNLMKTYRLNLARLRHGEDVEEMLDKELVIISQMVKEINAKRLVVDSVTSFGIWFEGAARIRALLFEFTDRLKNLNCTTLLTTETQGGRRQFSAFGIEEFVVDGVIALYFTPPNRSIFVKKMRGTNHSKIIHPFEIVANKGIVVNPKDRVLWESIK
jgi:KaiC/GvpD/RAD55 family RecA-like ATPase